MNTARFLADQHAYFSTSYKQFCAFGGPCVYFHHECLRARENGFLSDRHIEMLYATLTACTITAERNKRKYTYYRCTGYHGKCGNSYIREEQLANLLASVLERIQIPREIADWIAEGLRESQSALEQTRQQSLVRLTHRRQGVRIRHPRTWQQARGF